MIVERPRQVADLVAGAVDRDLDRRSARRRAGAPPGAAAAAGARAVADSGIAEDQRQREAGERRVQERRADRARPRW